MERKVNPGEFLTPFGAHARGAAANPDALGRMLFAIYGGCDSAMDINELMKAAQGLRTQLENAKEQAEKLRVTGEAGGGMVRVVMNGRYEVVELTIEPAAVSDDIKLVEDLTRAAVNQASAKVGEQLQGSLGSMAQGLGVDLSQLGFK